MMDLDHITSLGFMVVDPRSRHRVAYANSFLEHLSGPIGGLSRPLIDLLPEFDPVRVQNLPHGVPSSWNSYLSCRDGLLYEVDLDILPVFDRQERLDFYVIVIDLDPLSQLLDRYGAQDA